MPQSKRDKRAQLQQQQSIYESFRNRALVTDTDLTASIVGNISIQSTSFGGSFGYDRSISSNSHPDRIESFMSDAVNEPLHESPDELNKFFELPDDMRKILKKTTSKAETVNQSNQSINSFESMQKSFFKQLSALQRVETVAHTAAVTNELFSLLHDSLTKAAELKDHARQQLDGTENGKNDTFHNSVKAVTLLNQKHVHMTSSHPRNAGDYTVIAFVNSASGGGKGQTIYKTLQDHLGASYVVDLKSCQPGNMPEDILVQYAMDPMVRILTCGGDGTCGWIYSSLDKVWLRLLGESALAGRIHLSKYKDHLPMAIMPLGTGNDLSRQFHWGGKFKDRMKKKSMIQSICKGKLSKLDRWRCIIIPVHELTEEGKACIRSILSGRDTCRKDEFIDKLLESNDNIVHNKKSRTQETKLSKVPSLTEVPSRKVFDGVFCNYLSLGFDATIAYMFHHDREAHPEKFTSPFKNKLIYVQKSPAALRAPKLRGRMKIMVAHEDGELVNLPIPKQCRAVVLMNIRSYGGGNHLTIGGSPTDGLIEVIFVSNLIRTAASVAIGKTLPFMLFKVAAQTNRIIFQTTTPLHCQVDGEPWLQSEGLIDVKFHARNAILEKVKEHISCDCTSIGKDAVEG